MLARAGAFGRVLLVLILSLCAGGPAPAQASSARLAPGQKIAPKITLAERQDLSRPLTEMGHAAPRPSALQGAAELPVRPVIKPASASPTASTPARISPQSVEIPGAPMPAPLHHWEGVPNLNNVLPSDANGDVGPNHYVQWVNMSLEIWDKGGTSLYGPVSGNSIWTGFGGPCETYNDGDPIVLYDSLSDRWFISQFAINAASNIYYQCIALSQSPDPTGSWYRYAYPWSTTLMNDYGKFGVWSDGYYFSTNQFAGGTTWAGAGVAVFERDKMLQGLPARMLSFDLYNANPYFGGMLPADLDGQQAPPPGAPNPFVEWDDAWVDPVTKAQLAPDELRVWNFHVDWNQPGLSTFGNHLQPSYEIPTLDVTPQTGISSIWIPQPFTDQKLDAISDRLMYRLQYRNFGGRQVLVGNHSVDADGQAHAGIHWFELRSTDAGTTWSMFQQGVLAPDANSRWMGSLAMDGSGNMALGYSLSSASIFPSIAYSGRLATDPPGAMPQTETVMVSGAGFQSHTSGRWGDYSSLSVDPSDDCTFWYTQQFMPSSSAAGWKTEIGSFRFPSPLCTNLITGILHGTVTSSLDHGPLAGVKVSANGVSTTTDQNGNYRLVLQSNAYTVTADLFAYSPFSTSVNIASGAYIDQNIALTPIPLQQVSGNVRDGSGHPGMPLLARIDIPTYPYSPVVTDLMGNYQLALPLGIPFAFTVTALGGGYQPASRSVTPGPGANIENFDLVVDPTTCAAPGYTLMNGACLTAPGGLAVGSVQDANIPPLTAAQPITGASVKEISSGTSRTTGSLPPGSYTMFLAEGDHTLIAGAPGYGDMAVFPVTVVRDAAVRQDFRLPAGHLTVSPSAVTLSLLGAAPRNEFQLTLLNNGTRAVNFKLFETPGLALDLAPAGPFAPAGRRLSPKRSGERSAANIYQYVPPGAPAWPAGAAVLRIWPTNLAGPWGLAVINDTVWVSDAAGGGDGRLHPFSKDGQALPGAFGVAETPAAFLADLAYDPARGRLWQVAVSGEPCLVEIDPSAGGPTGATICPPFGSSQRGLAYDPVSRTFFSGTWNDAILSHFDRGGQLLDSADLGINIAGIAYHPGSRRLYILSNADAGYTVYVVEARSPYRILGGFNLPDFANFGQAGLDFSPDGHLWAVDSVKKQVIELSVGESALPNTQDVPWLSESPTSGILEAGQSMLVTAKVSANLLLPPQCIPTNRATFTFTTDTPYDNGPYRVMPVPVTVTAPCLYYFPRIPNR